jgi:5-methylcytosine-specific restriction protein A
MRTRSRRSATIAAGSNAAARKRAEIRRDGWAHCALCPLIVLPSAADVDHIIPIAFGGADVDSNIQVLCRPCHKRKTRQEFGHQTPPF